MNHTPTSLHWIVVVDCDRVAQLNNCRISLVGAVSAGCLGSTSKLAKNNNHMSSNTKGKPNDNVPAAIQVLKISTSFGILKWRIKKVLYFRNGLEVVRNLEPLHVFLFEAVSSSTRKSAEITSPWTIRASLWYLLKFKSFLLLFNGEARWDGLPSRQNVTSVRYKPAHSNKPEKQVSVVPERHTKKGNSRWWGVPKSWAVLMVIPTVVCKLPKRLKLRLGFLRYTLKASLVPPTTITNVKAPMCTYSPSLMQTSYRRRVQCSQNWSRSRIVI